MASLKSETGFYWDETILRDLFHRDQQLIKKKNPLSIRPTLD